MAKATPKNMALAVQRFYFLVSIVLGVIALDQGTKLWIMNTFTLHEVKEVVAGFFNLTYLYNAGAAFGLLAEVDGAWKKWLFVAVAVVAIYVILQLFKQYGLKKSFMFTGGLGLIGGGALGNVIDRLRYSAVIDFLDFYIGDYHWPAFNVADSAIVVGVGLFIYATLFLDDKEEGASSKE
ncbi:MAG: signal peptidase II [Thermodesulfobacteriota bacterium]